MAQMCIAIIGNGCPSKIIPLFRHVSVVGKHTGTKVFPCRAQDACRVSGSNHTHDLHVSTRMSYPATEHLPLPHNVDDIDANEVSRFSPQRDRDISGSVILSKANENFGTGKNYNQQSYPVDPHVASYDCRGALSLNSAMQSNVPEPYSTTGKSTHLNMPGGQWSQGQKYIAEDLQNSHYTMVPGKDSNSQGTSPSKSFDSLSKPVQFRRDFSILSSIPSGLMSRHYSTSPVTDNDKLSRKDKLKRAVKEYGATVIVFHVSISLLSLGGCYLAVTSGVEMGGVIQSLGPGSEVAAGAGQFVVAYAVHKVMAPIRISITLASTPFIVRYLRKIGFLKVPKASPTP